MADTHPYALLVELGEVSAQRLKIKLVKYFQSKKSNGTQDCEVQYENGSSTAVLRFRRDEDRKRVLEKESHQIALDKGVLRMTVRLPTDETTAQEAPAPKDSKKYVAVDKKDADEHARAADVQTETKHGDAESADEELSSPLALLERIPDTMNKEFLEMLVENILKDSDCPSAAQSFLLEVIPGISSAVVTFKTPTEKTEFVKRCPQNKTFTKKGLSVRHLESTEQIAVEGLPECSADILFMYFENAGGEVQDVELNEEEQSAIITLKNSKDVHKIMQRKYSIRQKEIRVYPFYQSLGTALYGKDRPALMLPAAIRESIDSALWKYLSDNQSAAETIRSDLAKHFCNVNLSTSSVCLSPASSLLHQQDAKALIKKWPDTIKSSFAQALTKFKSLKFQPESEVWGECEAKIRQTLQPEELLVVPDKANGVLSVVGLLADVNRHEQTLHNVISEIVKRVQREKMSVTQDIKMSQSVFHVLSQDGLMDKLHQMYPELKMPFCKNSSKLTITGFGEEIMSTNKIIYDAIFALKNQKLEIDKFVLDFLRGEQEDELTHALLAPHGIHAAFEIDSQGVKLVAVDNKVLNDAKDHLEKLLISKHIDVEDRNVLLRSEWKQLVSQLESTHNKSRRRIQIHNQGQQVVVSGYKDSVIKVSSEADGFLKQYAHVEETVMVKANVIVEYIKNQHDSSAMKQVSDKVGVTYKKEAICLSGSRVDVKKCKTVVEGLVSDVHFGTLQVPMPGVKKLFQEEKKMIVPLLKNDTGCLIQLVEDTSGGQGSMTHMKLPVPVYQVDTPDGVEIAVCKADMCSYTVDAVVNTSSEDLQHTTGLSAALVNAAGLQLQAECDNLIVLNGQLKPGECVITGAGGQLRCKKVIHAVGPHFDPARPQKPLALLKKAVKGSLELAESNGCFSVALPAISRNRNFPIDLCATTIVKAVKAHCEDNFDENSLKTIHFVDNDDIIVQAMEKAVRQEFGNGGISPPQQSSVKQGASKPDCLGRVQTKEGLDITLMKGKIENAKTDVVVNTVFDKLDLTQGNVSNAIFNAAGSKLQQLVNAKNASGTIGEIIATDGCKLKSKQVFHAVTPHWDKGKGEKALSGIFKDCLEKAENSSLTSISFPAIGTGNLGFPKAYVASSMLDEILTFSSKKQPKHLKKVVIILYSGDAQTIQAFSDEFKKKFPNALNVSVPTATPQSQGTFSTVVSSSGMHETKMGNVTIQVVTGDITKETTDVIVNSTNESFSLKSGVSKAILDAAGPAVETECQTLGTQPNQSLIITQPGNLKSKKILHLPGQTDPVKITNAVKIALEMCLKQSFTSVSFPAIGTGQGNAQAKDVADAMLDAVISVLSQNTSSSMKKIRIVIFQPHMLADFYNSMQQREAPSAKSKSFLGRLWQKTTALFSPSPDQPKQGGDFVVEPLKVDPACFHICGDSQTNVDRAKQWMKDHLSRQKHTSCIKEDAIINFSGADYQHINDIQKAMAVSILIESKNNQASLTIQGLSKDVLEATNEIHDMLKKARDEEDLRRKVEQAGVVAEWQYQLHGLPFQSFEPMTNYELEQALEQNLSQVKVTIQGQDHTVTMPKGPATDQQGRIVEIKRIDKLKDEDIPESWDTMPPNSTCVSAAITAGTPEYNDVQSLFKATCSNTITKIERIQNPGLWKSLQIRKHDMEQRNGHKNNEKRLFHGTDDNTVALINAHGFNRSYAGKNATCYGRGSYFAVKASYSAQDTYSKPNQNGEKFMYLCRVLTGDFAAGQRGMIAPPAKSANSIQLYDSVVDDLANPSMFIIFHDTQAYPEYLITFK